MGFEVGTVDHQSVRRARLAREPCEDAVEDAKAAPADEAVVEGFVRAGGGRRVAPAQAVADNEDDAARAATIIDEGIPWESGKKGLIRFIWAGESRKTSAMAAPPPWDESHAPASEQAINGS